MQPVVAELVLLAVFLKNPANSIPERIRHHQGGKGHRRLLRSDQALKFRRKLDDDRRFSALSGSIHQTADLPCQLRVALLGLMCGHLKRGREKPFRLLTEVRADQCLDLVGCGHWVWFRILKSRKESILRIGYVSRCCAGGSGTVLTSRSTDSAPPTPPGSTGVRW